MATPPSRVITALIRLHREFQEDAGHDPGVVTATACPLQDFPGFDSLLVPDAIRTLSRLLGVTLPQAAKIKDLYRSPDGTQKLTISEVAARFCSHFGLEAAA
jgi:hypothetical protein